MAVRISSGKWSTKKGFYDSILWFNDRDDALLVTPSPLDMRDACTVLYQETGIKSLAAEISELKHDTDVYSKTLYDVLGAKRFTLAMVNQRVIDEDNVDSVVKEASEELAEHIGYPDDAREWTIKRIVKAFKSAFEKVTL